MKCERYCLFVSDTGRKVTQVLHHDGEPPQYFDTFDGERLPLRMVGTYHADDARTSHVALAKQKARADWAEVERRRREFNARQFGRAS